MAIHARAILTGKVCQTDLVFGVPRGCISGSVHTRKQVFVCSGYDLSHPGEHPDTHRQHFDQFITIAQPAELKTLKRGHQLARRRCILSPTAVPNWLLAKH